MSSLTPPIIHNNSNEDAVADYIKTTYYNNVSDADMTRLLELYPDSASLGAPYGTGDMFQYFPMHKRIASLEGDIVIDAIRRFYTRTASEQGLDIWAYCELRDHSYRQHLLNRV